MSECKKLKRDFDGRALNETMQNNLEAASLIQSELSSVSKNMGVKIQSIIEEFNIQKTPLYDKRHEVLHSIPHFWAIAFVNHPKLKLLMNNSIEDCFNYLQHIQVIESDAKSFQIIFEFDENPYFYNTKLVKQFSCELDDFTMKKTVVNWKENMNLSSENVKKLGHKRGVPLENFFDWLVKSVGNDLICDIIRDDLWVDPLKHFFSSEDNTNESESESDEENDGDDFLDTKDDSSDENSSILSDNDNKTSQ